MSPAERVRVRGSQLGTARERLRQRVLVRIRQHFGGWRSFHVRLELTDRDEDLDTMRVGSGKRVEDVDPLDP